MLATACLCGFGVALFTHSFLDVRRAGLWLHRSLLVQMTLLAAAFLVSLSFPYEFSVRFVNLILPVMAVHLLIVSVLCSIKGVRQSKYFILAWTSVLAAIVLESLTSMGLVDLTWAGRFGTDVYKRQACRCSKSLLTGSLRLTGSLSRRTFPGASLHPGAAMMRAISFCGELSGLRKCSCPFKRRETRP